MSRPKNVTPFQLHRQRTPEEKAFKAGLFQRGTGETRKRCKKALSAEIELLTLAYLEEGNQIEELPNLFAPSNWKPAFNHNPHMEPDA